MGLEWIHESISIRLGVVDLDICFWGVLVVLVTGGCLGLAGNQRGFGVADDEAAVIFEQRRPPFGNGGTQFGAAVAIAKAAEEQFLEIENQVTPDPVERSAG